MCPGQFTAHPAENAPPARRQVRDLRPGIRCRHQQNSLGLARWCRYSARYPPGGRRKGSHDFRAIDCALREVSVISQSVGKMLARPKGRRHLPSAAFKSVASRMPRWTRRGRRGSQVGLAFAACSICRLGPGPCPAFASLTVRLSAGSCLASRQLLALEARWSWRWDAELASRGKVRQAGRACAADHLAL